MNSKTMTVVIVVCAIVLLSAINEANGYALGNCRRPCYGGPHDKCVSCGSRCPPTCANPNPESCALVCLLDVCECSWRYVRAHNGRCVRPQDCPRRPPGQG